jgi:hypothetical protein
MHSDNLDSFLPARSVWERYGVTSMSLYRWLDDEENGNLLQKFKVVSIVS